MEFLLSFLQNPIVSFFILLCPLVIVHEYGHYITAKLMGVTVEVFSVGFGKTLFSYKKGDTDYRFSLIPLGGYVKMFGDSYEVEVAPEDRHRAFITQPPYKKAAIAFAGPFFNIIFAVFVYQAIIMMGLPTIESHIGYVLPESPADKRELNPVIKF